MLHTENEIPGLPGSDLKVCMGCGDGGAFHLIMWSHQLRIGLKLGCDNKLIKYCSRLVWPVLILCNTVSVGQGRLIRLKYVSYIVVGIQSKRMVQGKCLPVL